MTEVQNKTIQRKLTIKDLINDNNNHKLNNKNNTNFISNDIPKNQKVFGHTKRIKP